MTTAAGAATSRSVANALSAGVGAARAVIADAVAEDLAPLTVS
jgi:hypothetical protein